MLERLQRCYAEVHIMYWAWQARAPAGYVYQHESYSKANEMSATATTSESNMLKELRQNESLCSTKPYAMICNNAVTPSRVPYLHASQVHIYHCCELSAKQAARYYQSWFFHGVSKNIPSWELQSFENDHLILELLKCSVHIFINHEI